MRTTSASRSGTGSSGFGIRAGRTSLESRIPNPESRRSSEPDGVQIFVYDNYPGGIGFSEPLFRHARRAARGRTRRLIAECDCENGCPGCVGPVGNTGPLAKAAALRILDLLLERDGALSAEPTADIGGSAVLTALADRLRGIVGGAGSPAAASIPPQVPAPGSSVANPERLGVSWRRWRVDRGGCFVVERRYERARSLRSRRRSERCADRLAEARRIRRRSSRAARPRGRRSSSSISRRPA